MGNQCAGSHTHAPRRQESASLEPPLLIKSPPPLSTEELEGKNSQLINLQLQAFETNKQGKHLAEVLGNERKKAVNLVQSVSEKVRQIREEVEKFVGEDGNVTQEGVAFVKSKRADIEELMNAVGNLSKTALSRTEDQFKNFVQKQEKVQKDSTEVLESVSDFKCSTAIPQPQKTKLAELDQTAGKISTLQDESKKSLAEIESNRAAIEAKLGEVPQLIAELAKFIRIEADSDSNGEIVVEEIQTYDVGREEMEVAAEAEEIQEGVNEELNEVEVAAEAGETPVAPTFEEIFNQDSEVQQTITESLLSQLPPPPVQSSPKIPPLSPDDVYQFFNQILTAKWQADSHLQTQPIGIDSCTVSFFLSKYGNSAVDALTQFSKVIQDMLKSNSEFAQFISDVLGIASAKPYPKVITDKIAAFATLLDEAIDTKAKIRSVEYMGHQPRDIPANEARMGGSLHLIDVLRAFAPLIAEYPDYGARFLEQIHPPLIQHTDFLHFMLVHHMKLANIDGIALFKQLSEDSILDFDEFSKGVRENLNWKISDESLQKLFYMIQNPDTQVIHRLDFIRFLRLHLYFENAENDSFLIPKLQILQAFGKVCLLRRRALITQLYRKFKEFEPASDTVTPETAVKVLTDLGEKREITDLLKHLEDGKGTFEDFIRLTESSGLLVHQKPYFSNIHSVPELPRTIHAAEVPAEVGQFLARRE